MVREPLKPWQQRFWEITLAIGVLVMYCSVFTIIHLRAASVKNGEYLRSLLVALIFVRELKRTISKHSLTTTRELKKKKGRKKKKKLY